MLVSTDVSRENSCLELLAGKRCACLMKVTMSIFFTL